MNNFLAAIIGSSVISSLISSFSTDKNNKYSNKFKARLGIKLKRIENLRNDLSKYISICIKIQKNIHDEGFKDSDKYKELRTNLMFLSNELLSMLGIAITKKFDQIDLKDFLTKIGHKDKEFNQTNQRMFRKMKYDKSPNAQNISARNHLGALIIGSATCYYDFNAISKKGRGCQKILNTLRDDMGMYLREQENSLIKEDLSNSQKAKQILKNIYIKSYIKDLKILKSLYLIFIAIIIIYFLLLPWINGLWNIKYIYRYLSSFSILIICNFFYYIYRHQKKN